MIAIILAGGKGSRLAPWPAPKCLLPINGVTILQRLITHLSAHLRRAIVCVGYRAGDVKASVREHYWDDSLVTFSDAGENAPMGARLSEVLLEMQPDERALVCYGDELADVDVKLLVEEHESKGRAMTFAAANQKVPGGTVERSRMFAERCRIIEGQEVLVNIGFVVVEPRCWALLRPEDGLSDWINRVAAQDKVGVHHHHGKRATVNSLADLQYAEEVWK